MKPLIGQCLTTASHWSFYAPGSSRPALSFASLAPEWSQIPNGAGYTRNNGSCGRSDADEGCCWLGIGALFRSDLSGGWLVLLFPGHSHLPLFVYLRVAFYFCMGANLLPMELVCRLAELGHSAAIQ